MHFNDRESIIALTPLLKGERLPDGRPKVKDKYLDALYGMTLEEVWKPIYVLDYYLRMDLFRFPKNLVLVLMILMKKC